MAAAHPKAPLGCYWRGNVLWAAAKVRGKRHAWTLRTSDPAIAAERREARLKGLRDPAGAEDAKRRLRAGLKMGRPAIYLTGQRFGELVVIERAETRTSDGRLTWLCRCDCGAKKIVSR